MSFRSWFRNWLHRDEEKLMASTAIARVDRDEFGEPIRFSVTPARGGVVVTSRTYDRQKDRNNEVIHVIHDDEDVARRVGEIVALELMKV